MNTFLCVLALPQHLRSSTLLLHTVGKDIQSQRCLRSHSASPAGIGVRHPSHWQFSFTFKSLPGSVPFYQDKALHKSIWSLQIRQMSKSRLDFKQFDFSLMALSGLPFLLSSLDPKLFFPNILGSAGKQPARRLVSVLKICLLYLWFL